MDERDASTYTVVANDEEQFSIWPSTSEPPTGWRRLAGEGSREQCLEQVRNLWTDLRPKSLRDDRVAAP